MVQLQNTLSVMYRVMCYVKCYVPCGERVRIKSTESRASATKCRWLVELPALCKRTFYEKKRRLHYGFFDMRRSYGTECVVFRVTLLSS